MKKLMILPFLLILSLNGYGQFTVTDPTSVAQRLVLAMEEMEEQIDQKYKFIQQIQIAQKAYESSKSMQEKVEKVSTYVKTAKEVVEIISLGEDIMRISKNMRKNVQNTNVLTENEKFQAIVDIVNCTTNISQIAKQASRVVQDKKSDNDVSLSDFERQQELRYLKNEMKEMKTELQRIYNNTFTGSMAMSQNKQLFSFINF